MEIAFCLIHRHLGKDKDLAIMNIFFRQQHRFEQANELVLHHASLAHTYTPPVLTYHMNVTHIATGFMHTCICFHPHTHSHTHARTDTDRQTHTHTHTHTHTPDTVPLGVVELLIEEDERRSGHKSCVGSKGHTETTSGGVKGLVHIATRDCLKQK